MNLRVSWMAALIVCLLQFTWVDHSVADVLWMADGRQLYGQVLKRGDGQLVLKPWESGRWQTPRNLKLDQVLQVRVNLRSGEWEQLNPDQPQRYLELAETLAIESADPSAAQVARRLYLLAVCYGTPDQVERGLHGLRQLTPAGEQLQSIEAYQFLQSGIQPSAAQPTSVPEEPLDAETRTKFLTLVQTIRREASQQAINLLRDEFLRERWKSLRLNCPLAELDQMARAPSLSRDQMRKLLTLEVALLSRAPKLPGPSSRGGWSEQSLHTEGGIHRLPTLDQLTEFDPESCVYRDGQWQRLTPSHVVRSKK